MKKIYNRMVARESRICIKYYHVICLSKGRSLKYVSFFSSFSMSFTNRKCVVNVQEIKLWFVLKIIQKNPQVTMLIYGQSNLVFLNFHQSCKIYKTKNYKIKSDKLMKRWKKNDKLKHVSFMINSHNSSMRYDCDKSNNK